MAFNNYNNGNTNNSSGDGEKRTNFPVCKIWGSDGTINASIWCNDTGVYTILSGKISVGKDPNTGNNVYEQKKPSELPRFFLNLSLLKALIDSCENTDPSQLNVVIDKGQKGGKLAITGSQTDVKFLIDSGKPGIGSREITVPAHTISGRPVHSDFAIFLDYMKTCYRKALYQKLDPEEFGTAIASSEDDNLPI